MARGAIPVTTVQNFAQGIASGFAAASWTAADATNDHSLDLTNAPNLWLVAINLSAGTQTFTIEYPATGYSLANTVSESIDIPAAAAGVPGMQIVHMANKRALDQGGALAHIDFGAGEDTDVHLMAFTQTQTPGV